jgi:hypothetical protein
MGRGRLGIVVVVIAGCTSVNPAYEGSESGGGGGTSSTGVVTQETSTSGTGPATGVVDGDATSSSSGTTSAISEGTSTTGETLEGGSTTEGPLACDRALWVTGNTAVEASGDTPFHMRSIELGFTVTVVENSVSQAEDVGDNCLVVLSPLGGAVDVEDKFRDVVVPVVTWEYNLYDNMRMVDPLGVGWGIADPLDQIEITNPAHPLAAGLVGAVSVYAGGGRISWGMPVGDVEIVATLPGDPSRATIFAFEAGAAMAAGFVAPARRVALGGGETPAMVTGEAVELFEAAVRWSVE